MTHPENNEVPVEYQELDPAASEVNTPKEVQASEADVTDGELPEGAVAVSSLLRADRGDPEQTTDKPRVTVTTGDMSDPDGNNYEIKGYGWQASDSDVPTTDGGGAGKPPEGGEPPTGGPEDNSDDQSDDSEGNREQGGEGMTFSAEENIREILDVVPVPSPIVESMIYEVGQRQVTVVVAEPAPDNADRVAEAVAGAQECYIVRNGQSREGAMNDAKIYTVTAGADDNPERDELARQLADADLREGNFLGIVFAKFKGTGAQLAPIGVAEEDPVSALLEKGKKARKDADTLIRLLAPLDKAYDAVEKAVVATAEELEASDQIIAQQINYLSGSEDPRESENIAVVIPPENFLALRRLAIDNIEDVPVGEIDYVIADTEVAVKEQQSYFLNAVDVTRRREMFEGIGNPDVYGFNEERHLLAGYIAACHPNQEMSEEERMRNAVETVRKLKVDECLTILEGIREDLDDDDDATLGELKARVELTLSEHLTETLQPLVSQVALQRELQAFEIPEKAPVTAEFNVGNAEITLVACDFDSSDAAKVSVELRECDLVLMQSRGEPGERAVLQLAYTVALAHDAETETTDAVFSPDGSHGNRFAHAVLSGLVGTGVEVVLTGETYFDPDEDGKYTFAFVGHRNIMGNLPTLSAATDSLIYVASCFLTAQEKREAQWIEVVSQTIDKHAGLEPSKIGIVVDLKSYEDIGRAGIISAAQKEQIDSEVALHRTPLENLARAIQADLPERMLLLERMLLGDYLLQSCYDHKEEYYMQVDRAQAVVQKLSHEQCSRLLGEIDLVARNAPNDIDRKRTSIQAIFTDFLKKNQL